MPDLQIDEKVQILDLSATTRHRVKVKENANSTFYLVKRIPPQDFFCQNCKFVNVKYSESAKFNTLSNNPMSRYLGNQLICLIFTKRQEDVFQLSQHHGAVLHFVIKLQAFNEVLKGSCVFGFLHVRVDGVELSKGKPQ